jgi:hypothetical protein
LIAALASQLLKGRTCSKAHHIVRVVGAIDLPTMIQVTLWIHRGFEPGEGGSMRCGLRLPRSAIAVDVKEMYEKGSSLAINYLSIDLR